MTQTEVSAIALDTGELAARHNRAFDDGVDPEAIEADEAANLIVHPLFLLAPRSSNHAEPREGSGCLYPGLNPALSARPHFSTGRSGPLFDRS